MPYELRLNGQPSQTFDTESAAVDAARDALRANPDAEPEVFDATTGKPATPASSKNWREELKQKMGF